MPKLKKKRKNKKRTKIKKINPNSVQHHKIIDNSTGYVIEENSQIIETDDVPKSLFDMLHFDKKNISKEKLLKEQSFKNKFDRLKNRIFLNKNFNELLDFEKLSSYNTYYIDEYTDEVDILLQELIVIFKKRAGTSLNISYNDYQTIDGYLENIKKLYTVFKQEGLSEDVKNGIDSIISANNVMRYYIF